MYKSILIVVLLILFTQNLVAQTESNKEKSVDLFAGFIVAPPALTIFDNDPIFTASTSLFFTTVMVMPE